MWTFSIFLSVGVVLFCTACQSPRTSASSNQEVVVGLLQEAQKAAETSIPKGLRFDAERFYFELAMAQVRAGDLTGACNTAQKINNPAWLQPDVYRAVARIYARHGDFEKGLTTLKLSSDACNWCTNQLLSEVAKGELEKTETTRAIETAKRISDPWLRQQTLLSLAERLANCNDRPQTRICVNQVITESTQKTNAYESSVMLGQAGRLLSKIGDTEAACLCFSNAVARTDVIDGEYAKQSRVIALGTIATNQAAAGLVNDSFRTLGIARKDAPESAAGDMEGATCAISIMLGEQGDYGQAMIAARQISHYKPYQDDAMVRLVHVQAKAHCFRNALATAELIEVLSRRTAAKLSVASAYAKAGDKTTALGLAKVLTLIPKDGGFFVTPEPFDFLHPRTWGILYESKIGFTMGSYHRTLEEAGELAGSAIELNAVLGTIPQSVVITNISQFPREVAVAAARAQGRNGSAEAIREWARDFQNAEVRPWLLVALANGLMDRKGLPEVKE